MKDQRYVRFPKQVARFLTGDYTREDDIVVPMFRELDEEEEAAFRKHARENYNIGDIIDEIFHPIWRDEARKMNTEWLEIGLMDWCCDPGNGKRPRDGCDCRCCKLLIMQKIAEG